jgi:hypothetical protein
MKISIGAYPGVFCIPLIKYVVDGKRFKAKDIKRILRCVTSLNEI